MFNEIGLPQEDLHKIFYANAKRFFALPDVPEVARKCEPAPVSAP
jgi:hypothetical protein